MLLFILHREERQHPKLMKLVLETSLPLELEPFELQLGEKLNYSKVIVNKKEGDNDNNEDEKQEEEEEGNNNGNSHQPVEETKKDW